MAGAIVSCRRCCAGGQASDIEDGNLTSHIVSCPPDSCLATGCKGHEYEQKGIAGCGIDSVGGNIDQEFAIVFAVWDLGSPAQMATAQRTMRIVSPCAADQIFCDGVPGYECGTLPCTARAQLAALAPTPQRPRLFFTQQPLTKAGNVAAVSVPCGFALPVQLSVCSNATLLDGTCGVDAVDSSGVASQDQLRSRMLRDVDSICSVQGSQNGTCALCPPAAIQQGTCPASSYQYTYYVDTADGLAAMPLQLQVSILHAAAAVSLQVRFEISIQHAQASAALQSVQAVLHESSQTNPVLAAIVQAVSVSATVSSNQLCREAVAAAGIELRLDTDAADISSRHANAILGTGTSSHVSYSGPLLVVLSHSDKDSAATLAAADMSSLSHCMAAIMTAAVTGNSSAKLVSAVDDSLSLLQPNSSVTGMNTTVSSSAAALPLACKSDSTGQRALDFVAAALQSSMKVLIMNLPELDPAASALGLLAADAVLGVSFCNIVSDLYASIADIISLALELPARLGFALESGLVHAAQAVTADVLTQCASLSLELQATLSERYAAGPTAGSDSSSTGTAAGSSAPGNAAASSVAAAFALDGYVPVAQYMAFQRLSGQLYALDSGIQGELISVQASEARRLKHMPAMRFGEMSKQLARAVSVQAPTSRADNGKRSLQEYFSTAFETMVRSCK